MPTNLIHKSQFHLLKGVCFKKHPVIVQPFHCLKVFLKRRGQTKSEEGNWLVCLSV